MNLKDIQWISFEREGRMFVKCLVDNHIDVCTR